MVTVFYQLCHLSLGIPVLSLAIPGLPLAIPGLSLLVPSQFQDVPDSSCLMVKVIFKHLQQTKSKRDNDLIHISEKISDPCVNNVRMIVYQKKKKTMKCMPIF